MCIFYLHGYVAELRVDHYQTSFPLERRGEDILNGYIENKMNKFSIETNPCELGTAVCGENEVCVGDQNEKLLYRCDCTGSNEWEDGKCVKGLLFYFIALSFLSLCIFFNRFFYG